jgi:hypothetical protein
MLMLDPKTFTGISSGILSMRKNVMAVRKTILKNKTTNQRLKTKTELANKRLQETRSKNEKEKSNEQKRNLGKKLKSTTSSIFKKPELAFGIPGIGALGSVITFFSVVLLGWMLKALPKIKKAVEDFIKRAKTLIDQLGSFLNGIKKFFVAIFSALELMYKKLGFGGQDSLKPEDVKDTKDKIGEAKDALTGFITNFPQHITNFTKGLAELFDKDYKKNKTGEGVAGTSGDYPSVSSGGTNGSLKSKIRSLEAGGNYAAVFTGYLSGFSRKNEDITKMTIAQVVKYQKDYIAHQRALGIPEGQRSAAVGAYQMLYPEIAAKAVGVSNSAIFNKQTQDKLAEYYLNVAGQQAFQRGEISAGEYNDRLAGQFASIRKMSGGGVYDNDGINRAYGGVYQEILDNKPDEMSTGVKKVKYPTAGETNAQKSSVFEPVRSNQERETFLSQSGGPKKISIDKDVVIPIQLNRSTKEDYDQAFAAADSISITSVDGDSVYEDLIGG